MLKFLINLFFETSEKKLAALQGIVEKINSFEPAVKKLSDSELRAKTEEFRSRISNGESLDDILPEAFALVREASVRTIGLRHFDVQLLGGIILHQGKISEMKTGEGKTLAATLPLYLNTLSGKGCHLVTVNDYLAKRDRNWMGPVYEILGLTVGVIQHDMDYAQRKAAYSCDITYGTNNEFGFDYLRDNMATTLEQCVQRELNYAIVDEVDSILIDEARTPLIISGVVEENIDGYLKADQIVRHLQIQKDFTIDEKAKNAILTEDGFTKVEKILNIESLYDIVNMEMAHQILQSLKAHFLYKKDIDYVEKDNEIIIVDEFTGRLMFGRRYSDGLHQAIEAKERVKINEESQTLATISFQNYFRIYKKLAGMTGTAITEEAEFSKIYKLDTIEVPTHQPMVRDDMHDIIYKTKKEKFKAIINEVVQCSKIGRPVLVGTISIENSEILSELLGRHGVDHHVLNAKHHEREAEIVSKAGQKKAVTIATNMAGRGTDIVLGPGVVDVGGLYIIGSERHESRRIDNQLRGRSGRQGDPGSSRFYVSLEDDLMRLFGSQRISSVMDRLGIEEDTPIEHGLISRAIEGAQKKVEQYHFNIRKQLIEYDDVMNKQRTTIYELRRRILEGRNLSEKISEIIESVSTDLCSAFIPEKVYPEDWDYDGLYAAILEIINIDNDYLKGFKDLKHRDDAIDLLKKMLKAAYEEKCKLFSPDQCRDIERLVMLQVIDNKWIDHLHNMDELRDGIGLRAYGQKDPLIEYKIEGYEMFQSMMRSFRSETLNLFYKVQIMRDGENIIKEKQKKSITYSGSPEVHAPAQRRDKKVGRNDPCPCGSGKKYKKCCGSMK